MGSGKCCCYPKGLVLCGLTVTQVLLAKRHCQAGWAGAWGQRISESPVPATPTAAPLCQGSARLGVVWVLRLHSPSVGSPWDQAASSHALDACSGQKFREFCVQELRKRLGSRCLAGPLPTLAWAEGVVLHHSPTLPRPRHASGVDRAHCQGCDLAGSHCSPICRTPPTQTTLVLMQSPTDGAMEPRAGTEPSSPAPAPARHVGGGSRWDSGMLAGGSRESWLACCPARMTLDTWINR